MEMDESKQPHPTDVVVGQRLRAARVACGMSQSALAEAIGVTFQQVQKYENGTNRISASKLVEMASTLKVSAASFLMGLGDPHTGGPAEGAFTQDSLDLLAVYTRLPAQLRKAVFDLAVTLSVNPGDNAP